MNTQRSVHPGRSFGHETMRLAFQLWERAGSPMGREEEFWIAAEQQLRQQLMKAREQDSQAETPAEEKRESAPSGG